MADETAKSVVDVSKPGTTPPDTTGKPVIVSHKPMIKDPMVNDEVSVETDVVKDDKLAAPLTKEANKVIEPLSKSDGKPAEVVKEDSKTEVPETEEAAVVDAVLDQKSSKKKSSKDPQDTKEKDDQIEKLIESKKYFLKIRTPKRKRNKRTFIVALLIILLGLIGFVLAADAKLIPISVPVDLIKTQEITTDTPTQPLLDSSLNDQKNDTTESVKKEADEDKSAPVSASGDLKRQTDVQLIHNELEAYFAKKASYPTLDQMNSLEFVTANMPNITSQKVQDPDAKDALFVSVPTAKVYSYQATSDVGDTCDNASTTCTKYTLTATLSDGTTYVKTSLGSSTNSQQ